ncbi:fumarylacetoacetate hydrolase family protein [Rhodococcus artemisiae]|uniref:Fumarylacetoacetate hydrolase family protein n=1 Tax=Rhodococcus artemisiae TaxID=714159 RepID=A0ABU7L945_9NOCA|nr:fumarylacetoacetate hydrolase family protein [Rhodococcus artemisiae]MEE2058067.1 fumarylacetoacetate hydrolase family protein [Rhodococcus artemisiae]
MRIYNLSGRAALGVDGGAVDIADASHGLFSPSPQQLYTRWEEFTAWASGFTGSPTLTIDESALDSPVPLPPQVFAIGMNYREHAVEAGLPIPEIPVVFTKFPASVTGPCTTISLPEGQVDFESELVVVIGKRAENVATADAWTHIAGLTIGQDLSERITQWAGSAPQQFGLGKSFTGFSPLGPAVVTPDEFTDPTDLELGCTLNGVSMQKSRTSDMIFSIADVIAYLSSIVPLLPGDVVFTGTPSGIGATRDPKVLLRPGDELTTYIEGIGTMVHTFSTRPAPNGHSA